ncbi:hypothetical protein SAMN05660776_0629 [Salegentibacter holothuriorum]|uniref:Uncharacterized protein n=1 Tax=Salegentibacter holothuriorum TaxID=241145 RepID=A0A1T5AJB6_9FLAO|nr:hypothetical protein [Salegentibacter holothuriorum]SKB35112.1 hypothetical protein SAMN05660776_0629 [Salegentibacter holothuriorum]
MKFKYLLILLILFFNQISYSQANKTSDSKEFFYNISIGAVIGAIGALINKKADQKIGEILIKGSSQGALGGYITFESKRIIRFAQREEDWRFFWVAKLINAGGISIKENAALNRDFWKKWHINIGFSRIEFDLENQFKVRYKVMPIAFVYTIGIASQTRFELEKTIKTGEFIFSSDTNRFVETNSVGIALPGNIVLYEPNKDNFGTLSHEIIHLYQSNDFSQFEAFLDKPLNKINSKGNLFSEINKYIHYDFRYIPLQLSYIIEMNRSKYYYANFLEREAGYYSDSFQKDYLR